MTSRSYIDIFPEGKIEIELTANTESNAYPERLKISGAFGAITLYGSSVGELSSAYDPARLQEIIDDQRAACAGLICPDCGSEPIVSGHTADCSGELRQHWIGNSVEALA